MKAVLLGATLLLALAAPASAMDAEAAALARGYKAGKNLPITDVAVLMRTSERWCYNQQGTSCDWSDIYLDVSASGATYELGDLWDAETEIALTEEGVFRDGQFICETGEDYTATLRARRGGTALAGRELFALKTEMEAAVAAWGGGDEDCFDYIFVGFSPQDETVTLTQRIWRDGTTDPGEDAEVTLHFNAGAAARLSMRW